MDKGSLYDSSGNLRDGNLWVNSWYCIRKANLGIENINLMTDATQEEKDIILGQLYFFRAWWHFELIQWFGGMPYIDVVLPAEVPELPRLTFQECADKCAEDFRKAADLLPMDWNDTVAGLSTTNNNDFYATKGAALGYLGKTYLWAASPLMENGAMVGASTNGKTYAYNKEYATKAADALGEFLSLVEAGATQFALVPFGYDDEDADIYNHDHEGDRNTVSRYTDIFYTAKQNFKQPGSTEGIFKGPNGTSAWGIWNFGLTWGPKVNSIVTHDCIVHHPTANLIDQYGMANGLPIDDPNSGYDKTHPYKDRDPRFYHDIIFDGFEYVVADGTAAGTDKYATLYTGGDYRSNDMGSRTGYYVQKLVPHQINLYDWNQDWGKHYTPHHMYIRLADVYLMYAEATAAMSDGAQSTTSSNCTLTSVDAVNRIRQRCGAGDVQAADGDAYFDEIRRERAVELSMEGFRFNDLQRWLLLTEAPYNTKYSHEFTRVQSDEWYETNDPRDAEVQGLTNKTILTRQFGVQHYWLPLKVADVSIYAEFNQNPGW